MPQLVVLPHVELCPDGAVIDATPGKSICDNLLDHGIEIEHACEKSCACTTCHVVIREGFNDLTPSEEDEDDLLDPHTTSGQGRWHYMIRFKRRPACRSRSARADPGRTAAGCGT